MSKSFVKNIEREKLVKLALPIKTPTGQIAENYLRLDENEAAEEEEKKRIKAEAIVDDGEILEMHTEQIVVKIEKPTSAIGLIREKKMLFEISKEKISFLSRQFISNPQEEVYF